MTSKQLLFERPIPQGWQMLTVDEIKANEPHSCVAGPFGSNISSKYFVSEGVPVIRGNNLTDNLTPFVPHGFAFVSEEKAKSFKAQQVKGGDLVFTCWGTLGQVGLIPYNGPYPAYIISNKQLKLRPNLDICDPRFLYYYFASPQMVQHIRSVAIGAAVPGINLGILKSLQVVLPPLQIQRKIAAILSAYDNLIENNTRRINILEEMARSLYREWFVNFRFPGHEQVEMVDSELGLTPEGWQVKGIGEVIETLGGGTPSTKEPKYWQDGDLLWYTPSDLTSTNTMFIVDSEKKITALGLQKSSARMFPPYSVMLTSRATIGVVAINTKAACTNQGFITCIPNKQLSAYQIYFWLAENKDKIISLASGATFKEINKTTFRKLPIVIADEDTRQRFFKTLNPIFKQIKNFQDKNVNLRYTRDLLLPKLFSGEIDVEKLEIDIRELAV